MTRWSLRRRRQADEDGAGTGRAGAYRPDPYPPAGPEGAPARIAAGTDTMPAASANPWPDIAGQFGLHLLALAEQLRTSLDALESDEDDPERLQKLYQVDHAVTRMRRASLDLRTLAGRGDEDLAAPVTSLLDVIRMAMSAIERYGDVTVAKVADLAVLGYAADDVSELMAALLDNATRYSRGGAAVSAHLTADGSVLFRVEDSGIGIAPQMVADLNATLAGPVLEIDSRSGLRTGFPVVHRIARKHGMAVRLASRPGPASGTIVMVMLPAHLLCEIPAEPAPLPRASTPAGGPGSSPTPLSAASRRTRMPRAPGAQTPRGTRVRGASPALGSPTETGLPLRERASLRAAMERDRGPSPAPAPEQSPEERAAARRAFADDITAFSLGSLDGQGSQESARKGTQ
ncbi:MAG: ATP-binding protein [Trebonia sp.]